LQAKGAARHVGDDMDSSRLNAGKSGVSGRYAASTTEVDCHIRLVRFGQGVKRRQVRTISRKDSWHNGWVVGFVDGEGCFSCPIFRNRKTALGWQAQPEFSVVQSAVSRDAVEDLVVFFGCGHVTDNRRNDNHRSHLSRYRVTRLADLRSVIVPFFKAHQLRTSKRNDFEKFAQIVDLMQMGTHQTIDGIIRIAEISQTMNRCKPSNALRILRDHTPTISRFPP
jgi:hypothetical protein